MFPSIGYNLCFMCNFDRLIKNILTVGGPDVHVLESHSVGGLHDHLDRLLSVYRSHVAVTFFQKPVEGGLEREIRGIHDVYTGHAVVVNLRGMPSIG